MSAARVILITVAGPGGHVDVGVRSDATPEDLAEALGGVIGVSRATSVIEHRSPPRPGVPDGGRALVRPGTVLADAGVADGDLVLFRAAGGAGSFSWPEVQGRPAEFGDGSPPPGTPAFGPPAEPVAPDIWPSAEPAVEPGPANAGPDSAEPGPAMRFVRASEPAVGRHARDRTSPAAPDPDTTEIWRHDSQEVNTDDWRG
jgi:hypothetical protein